MSTEPTIAKPYLLELGMGTDLVGTDATKAAVRAVKDAIGRNRLLFVSHSDVAGKPLRVRVTIGVPDPDAVDIDAVRAALPEGEPTVAVQAGGLQTVEAPPGGPLVVAVAAITVGTD